MKNTERWLILLCGFVIGMVAYYVYEQPVMQQRFVKAAPAAPAPTAKASDSIPERHSLEWAVDMIDRLDRSLSIAHRRIEQQREEQNRVDRELDLIRDRLKSTPLNTGAKP